MAKSGGGITSNKVVSGKVIAGKGTTNAITPRKAAQIGVQVVETKSVQGVTQKGDLPLGNSLVNNVGKGGPGKGRTVLPSGGQGRH